MCDRGASAGWQQATRKRVAYGSRGEPSTTGVGTAEPGGTAEKCTGIRLCGPSRLCGAISSFGSGVGRSASRGAGAGAGVSRKAAVVRETRGRTRIITGRTLRLRKGQIRNRGNEGTAFRHGFATRGTRRPRARSRSNSTSKPAAHTYRTKPESRGNEGVAHLRDSRSFAQFADRLPHRPGSAAARRKAGPASARTALRTVL